ncbi:MAG: hypothetical protein DLM55_05070 [Acidimicrobiales bacterium]|nr:MAG: hypothetical protein DLM55_05070 [Acidimicrobiales bacterium]
MKLVRVIVVIFVCAGSLIGSTPVMAHTNLEHVVVVGVPGLRWTDVSPSETPTLAALADHGSVGTLSVRSAPAVTCPAEGWLTMGAGTYAAIKNPDQINAQAGCSERPLPKVEIRAPGAHVPAMPGIVSLNENLRFGAKPGWLSASLPCVSAIGSGAALAAASSSGDVRQYAPAFPTDSSEFLRRCPATIVAAQPLPSDAGTRVAALRAMDSVIKQVQAALPMRSALMVVGVSEDNATQSRLHPAVITGPGFGKGWLRSPSSRRVPYVQLSDVAPTVLAELGQSFPDTVAGRPMEGEQHGRPSSLSDTLDELIATDNQAVQQHMVIPIFFIGYGIIFAFVIVSLGALLRRQERDKHVREKTLLALRGAALGLATVPTATFLANLMPWWSAKSPELAIYGAVALFVAVSLAIVSMAGYFAGAKHRMRVEVCTLSAITLGVFLVDVLTGGGLQIDTLLGYNPLVAGRFVGLGGIAFSVLASAVVLLAAFLAVGRPRWAAVAIVAGVAAPVLWLVGSPSGGAKFGGVLTLVPTFVVLGLLVAKTAINWRRLLLAVSAGFLLAGVISWADYLRPANERSHFGRFAGSVLNGTAFNTIDRKIRTNIDLLLMGPHTVLAFLLVVVLVVLVFRPPSVLVGAFKRHEALRPALLAEATLGIIGFTTNDSGVAVPLVVSLTVVPLTLAICATKNDSPSAPWRLGQGDHGQTDSASGHAV